MRGCGATCPFSSAGSSAAVSKGSSAMSKTEGPFWRSPGLSSIHNRPPHFSSGAKFTSIAHHKRWSRKRYFIRRCTPGSAGSGGGCARFLCVCWNLRWRQRRMAGACRCVATACGRSAAARALSKSIETVCVRRQKWSRLPTPAVAASGRDAVGLTKNDGENFTSRAMRTGQSGHCPRHRPHSTRCLFM